MKKLASPFVAAVLLLSSLPAWAAKPLLIVATVPELADIAARIGGERVRVESLAKGKEDIHQVVMRPSFVAKLNKADAAVYLGLSIEDSFLTGLLAASANPALRSDPIMQCSGPGCIDCSQGMSVLERPETLNRAEGDIHPQGNPHYNLDPESGARIARNIASGLSRIDPANAALYEKGLKEYLSELEPKVRELKARAAPLKGVKAVSYHKDVAYLGRFTGLDFIATVELKPGVAPTPTHLASLVAVMKEQGVRLIVREQQYEAKTVDWLAERTGAKVAVIGTMSGSLPGTRTYLGLCEANLKALLAAAGKE
ncbi:MAG: zinc ABC transporter substrate-binding protein [Elusimicrobia bacterium]|nr:zinc ABC transporter substrate-binding protein [Elusimicrobiota bacterium]